MSARPAVAIVWARALRGREVVRASSRSVGRRVDEVARRYSFNAASRSKAFRWAPQWLGIGHLLAQFHQTSSEVGSDGARRARHQCRTLSDGVTMVVEKHDGSPLPNRERGKGTVQIEKPPLKLPGR